jgi:ATP-GRASP peptide maturase of grasp-with-spasm system
MTKTVIISKDRFDNNPSYKNVIDWLYFKKANVEFIDGQDFFEDGKNWSVNINSESIIENLDTFKQKSIWFRGFLKHRYHFKSTFDGVESNIDNLNELRRRLGQETTKITTQVFKQYSNCYQLPKFDSLKIDKYSVLKLAKKVGLSVPNSIITNSVEKLTSFLKQNGDAITKSLHESIYFSNKTEIIFYGNEKVTLKEVLNLKNKTFFPSLFQKYIEKEIEIRTFYIENKFYSMAIFYQLDRKTSTDFRNYNDQKPNRFVPYKLPKEIEEKIHVLMTKLDLNTGSIDFIKTAKAEFVFLEVNPTGQFGFTSKPCNYYLEEIIANTLIQNCK